MKPSGLCMNCMCGAIVNNRCTACNKAPLAEVNRNVNALPLECFIHNRYYIGKVLGAGGFGITYMAWDSVNKCRVALKELFPCNDVFRSDNERTVSIVRGQKDYFEHVKQRFLDEARILASLGNYSEIINVYHLFADNNTAYYAMEYVDGEDLKTYVRKNGKMYWEQLKKIVENVVSQLMILHNHGLIHRDISPDNIFKTRSGQAKLIDFGSVRTYTGHKGLTTFLKHNYAPIEQYRENGHQGPWTDIYALSVSMYYLMSGKLPPKAPDRVMNDTVVPLCQLEPSVPENVSRVISKGMSVQPQNRYTTVKEFWEALCGGINCAQSVGKFAINCNQGVFGGRSWQIQPGKIISVGRDALCTIKYPIDAPGVSRRQFSLALDKSGRPCIRDDGSSYGTFVNGIRIKKSLWLPLKSGNIITFAHEKYIVCYL